MEGIERTGGENNALRECGRKDIKVQGGLERKKVI